MSYRPLRSEVLCEMVDTRDVALLKHGKYANLYEITFDGEMWYEIVSNVDFTSIYKTQSYLFATRRFQETNEE